MAKLNRSKLKKPKRTGSVPKAYRSWLGESQDYNVCAYCLVSCDYPEIEHYIPKSYLKSIGKNPHNPENLYLACHDCNNNKLDYHPKNIKRRRLSGESYKFQVLNSFRHDFLEYYFIDAVGIFSPALANGKRLLHAKLNIVLFGFDQRFTLAQLRTNILRSAQTLEGLLRDFPVHALEYNDRIRSAASIVWKNRLMFAAFGIELSAKLKRFAKKEWLLQKAKSN